MVELKCRAETAVTGRSACRNENCENSKERGGRIPQGKLRWGIGGPGGHSMKWYCIRPKCLPADQVKDMLVPEKCESAAVMDGVAELPDGFREATITCLEAIRDDRADQLAPEVLAKLDEVGPLLPAAPRPPARDPVPPVTVGRQGLRRVKRLSAAGASSAAGDGDDEEGDDSGDDERASMGRGSVGGSSISSIPARTPPALLIPRRTGPGTGGDSPIFPPPEKVPKLDDFATEAGAVGGSSSFGESHAVHSTYHTPETEVPTGHETFHTPEDTVGLYDSVGSALGSSLEHDPLSGGAASVLGISKAAGSPAATGDLAGGAGLFWRGTGMGHVVGATSPQYGEPSGTGGDPPATSQFARFPHGISQVGSSPPTSAGGAMSSIGSAPLGAQAGLAPPLDSSPVSEAAAPMTPTVLAPTAVAAQLLGPVKRPTSAPRVSPAEAAGSVESASHSLRGSGLPGAGASSTDAIAGSFLGSGTDAVASALDGIGEDLVSAGDPTSTLESFGGQLLRGTSAGLATSHAPSAVGGVTGLVPGASVAPASSPAAQRSADTLAATAAATPSATSSSAPARGDQIPAYVGPVVSGTAAHSVTSTTGAASGSSSSTSAPSGAGAGGMATDSYVGTFAGDTIDPDATSSRAAQAAPGGEAFAAPRHVSRPEASRTEEAGASSASPEPAASAGPPA